MDHGAQDLVPRRGEVQVRQHVGSNLLAAKKQMDNDGEIYRGSVKSSENSVRALWEKKNFGRKPSLTPCQDLREAREPRTI